MNWQPPPNRPGGNPPGASPAGGTPPSGAGGTAQPPAQPAAPKDLSLYQLLQVDRDAHVTIIRYAYRFLAAMYHPDNGETGDAEKFRVITEAWKTLSDEGRRAAYDMSLGVQETSKGKAAAPKQKINEYGKDSLPNIPKTGVTWNEIELRLGVLQILLAAKKKRPQGGGASGKMLMDILNIDNVSEIEFCLWYLREKGWIAAGERHFEITAIGVDYLTDQLSKTQILDGGTSSSEKKVNAIVNSGLPAVLPKQPQ